MPVEYDEKGARIAWDGISPFFVRAKFPIQFSRAELKPLCKVKAALNLWNAIDKKLGVLSFRPDDLEVFSSKASASNLETESSQIGDAVSLIVVVALEIAPTNFGDQPAISAQDARKKMLKWTTEATTDPSLWDTLQEWNCVDAESTLAFWGDTAYQLDEADLKVDLADFIGLTTTRPVRGPLDL